MAKLSDLRLRQMVWPLQPVQRICRKSMKVLALGVPRTGTDSLRTALAELGYEWVYHGFDHVDDPRECVTWLNLWRRKQAGETLTAADFDTVLGHCEAVTDLPACLFAPDLVKAYPDAKVIINHRPDFEAWQRSVIDTWSNAEKDAGWLYHVLIYFHARMYWLARHEAEITQMGFFCGNYRKNLKRVYFDHYKMLDSILPPDKSLKWTVQDGWKPLCEFLSKPVPTIPFPHKNTLDQVLQRVVAAATKDGMVAFVRMLGLLSVLMIIVSWLLFVR